MADYAGWKDPYEGNTEQQAIDKVHQGAFDAWNRNDPDALAFRRAPGATAQDYAYAKYDQYKQGRMGYNNQVMANQKADISQKIRDQAEQFNKDMPTMGDRFHGQIEDEERRGVADKIRQQQYSFNKRGLLYSGKLTAAEENAKLQGAQQAAQRNAKVNQSLMDTANQLNAASVDDLLQNRGADIQAADLDYNNALQQLQNRQAQWASIGKAGGALGAAAVVGRK